MHTKRSGPRCGSHIITVTTTPSWLSDRRSRQAAVPHAYVCAIRNHQSPAPCALQVVQATRVGPGARQRRPATWWTERRGEEHRLARPSRARKKKGAGTAELNRQRRGRAGRLLRFGPAEASPVTWPAVVAERTEERKRPRSRPRPRPRLSPVFDGRRLACGRRSRARYFACRALNRMLGVVAPLTLRVLFDALPLPLLPAAFQVVLSAAPGSHRVSLVVLIADRGCCVHELASYHRMHVQLKHNNCCPRARP